MSLARAATVAAVSPANRRHLRSLPYRPLEYRRADGHRELPHESDADNWVPPPPAYTATAAAAQSVSLSHPDAPPVPRAPSVLSSSSMPPASTLPNTSVRISQVPMHLYQQRQQSILSNTSFAPDQERGRRPTLIHPSTYPAPHPSDPMQSRRSSSVRPSAGQVPYSAHPAPSTSTYRSPHQTPVRNPVSEHVNRDLYSPPSVSSSDPANTGSRRVSAPHIQRRPVPQNASVPAPYSNFSPSALRPSVDPRMAALPPLIPPTTPHQRFASPHQLPTSAPPLANHAASFSHRAAVAQTRGQSLSARGGGSRMDTRQNADSEGRDNGKKAKRRTHCVIM